METSKNDFVEFIKSRKSIRRFIFKKISNEVIKEILECARWAPSGRNTQPWQVCIVIHPTVKRMLSELTKYGGIIEEAYVNLVEQERSLAQQQKSTTAVMYHRALQFLETGRSAYKCSAAERNFAILYNGDMIPCRRMPIVVGNVLQDTISELFFNNSTMQDLRTFQVSTGCENCNHKNTCNGGLKCLAYRNFADYRKADPGCWLAE